MVVEREYTDDGRPAYVIVHTNPVRGGFGDSRAYYPRYPQFQQLWDAAAAQEEAEVAPDAETE